MWNDGCFFLRRLDVDLPRGVRDSCMLGCEKKHPFSETEDGGVVECRASVEPYLEQACGAVRFQK